MKIKALRLQSIPNTRSMFHWIPVSCLLLLACFSIRHIGAVDPAVSKCDKNPLTELTFQLSGSSLKWPCDSTKNIYVQSGRYVPRNVIATRAQLLRDAAFVALPRYKQGVPFTLGKVNLKKGECLTKIAPYPCWAIQEEGNCQALQSVVDIAVDPIVSRKHKDYFISYFHNYGVIMSVIS